MFGLSFLELAFLVVVAVGALVVFTRVRSRDTTPPASSGEEAASDTPITPRSTPEVAPGIVDASRSDDQWSMPSARRYGKIGPNVFQLYVQNAENLDPSEIHSERVLGDRKDGITNGLQFPGSMSRCHEGHLACLLSAAKRRFELGNPELAVFFLKVLLGEESYKEQFVFDIDYLFPEARRVLTEILEANPGLSGLEPVEYYRKKWGARR